MSETDLSGGAVRDFLAEAEEILDNLCAELGVMSDCVDDGECSPDLLNSIFRGAHSLKGLAGMFGFIPVQELSHSLENLLDSLRLGKTGFNQPIMALLVDSFDALGTMIRSIGDGETGQTPPDGLIGRIDASLMQKSASDSESVVAELGIPASILNALTEYEEYRLLDNYKKNRNILSILASFSLATFDQDLAELTELLKNCGEVISTLPSIGSGVGANIDFEILYGSTESAEVINLLTSDSNVTVRLLGSRNGGAKAASVKPSHGAEFLPEPDVSDAPEAPQESQVTAKSMSRTVRVDIGKLDDLMNIVGELVLSHSTISDVTEKMRNAGVTHHLGDMVKAAKGFERKLGELQKGVMEIRMIPVGQLYDKMGRIVRKISREQGKKVDLRTVGGDTELDKLIMEDIADPLMHIIRNAIDHGIEIPEERLAAGKSERGMIKLSSYQKGNHVVIEVEDDGRGIDIGRVKRKAVERGIINSIDSVADKDAIDLIFLPGFSTSETVSEISGRGVGMDVVKNNIAAVSGMVDVETLYGKGSRMIITLPITLAIIKALIISSAGKYYAIPITSVLESIMFNKKDLLTVERKEVIKLRDATLPLLRLDRFFNLADRVEGGDSFFVVVVGVAEKRLGLVVDELLGQQDIVIKPLGPMFEGVRGISGAADLGDQRTILVLDVSGIIHEATRSGGQV